MERPKTPGAQDRQLAAEYQRIFRGYPIDENWIKQARSSGLQVENVNAVASFLDANHEAQLESLRAKMPDIADSITKDHVYTMNAQRMDLSDLGRVREYVSNTKNAGAEGGKNMATGLGKVFNYQAPKVEGGTFDQLKRGFGAGFQYGSKTTADLVWDDAAQKYKPRPAPSINADDDFVHYARSAITERAPKAFVRGNSQAENIGYVAGRVVADATGHGSRKYMWNLHPLDIAWTQGANMARKAGYGKGQSRAVGFLVQEAVGLGSGNYDLTNVRQGGRPKGYQAISADPNDPRKSTNPLLDLTIQRGLLGRTGKLLPWEQFKQERPDVRQEDYQEYRDWLVGADPNLIDKLSLGVLKMDANPVTGLDIRLLGYHLSPVGIAAGVATTAALTHPKTRKFLNSKVLK